LNIQLVSAQNDGRTAWFEEARFGMFIHWGLYSAAEGLWKGEKLRYVNNYAEWIRYRNRISKEEYGELAKRFVWDRINPEEWVIQAKEAGMKYIVMTSKHHDGVALWDTKVGNYSLSKLAGVDRDIIKELADACRKHDMKLGFYYSHWIDWEHPFAWDHNQELTGHVTDAQFNQYWQEKAIPQLRELLTNYGDIAVMWFDMWIPYEKTIFKREQLEQAAALIRELQPNCLINSRLGFPAESEYVDFETLGDNVFGTAYTDHPWETPGTIAHSWGFSSQEKEWKSTSQLFQSLIGNVSLNGGYTLNIGPRADGSIPYESVSRLREIGEWTKKYGEALYNNTGSGLRAHQHDWGEVTRSQMDNVLYLHVMNWPLDRVLRVSGVQNQPTKVELLTNKGKQLLSYEQQGPLLHINLPENSVDPYDSVIKLSCSNDITIDRNIVAESTFGGFSLQNQNVLNAKDLKILKYDGKRPARIVSNGETAEWEVYFPRTGAYKLDLSAHNPSGTAVSIEVHIGSQVVQAQLQPDGKVVAEPNENNYTDEFVDRHLQEFKITKTGKQKVTFRVVDQQPIWLNRIWIEHKK
jgi:alpha-L-fucosidase